MSQQINLLNPLLKKRRDYFSFTNLLQALGFVIFGSLLFYGYAVYQERQLNMQFNEATKRFEAEKTRMILLEAEFSPQQTSQMLQDEVVQMEKKLAAQTKLVETMKSGAGGNTSGYSEYMRAFSRQAVQGLWLTGFMVNGDGTEINLSGAALNPELVPVYIQRLGNEKIMHGKAFSTLQIQAASSDEKGSAPVPHYVQFTLHSLSDVKPDVKADVKAKK